MCSSGEPLMCSMNWTVASFCSVKNHFSRSPTYFVLLAIWSYDLKWSSMSVVMQSWTSADTLLLRDLAKIIT